MEGKTELQRNFIAEARRKELESFQRALDIQWLNSRMEDGRMGRCLALIQREAEMEKDFQERTDHAAIVNARAQKETALGIEVAKVRREEACELLRRHYLRERDPSLRELFKKLQAGYVCRDLRQQIQNNEYKRLQDKAEEQHANFVLRNALYNDHEAKEREEREKMERNSRYCKELQQQLVNRQRQKQCQYEDSLIEKKMLDEIMRTISDEDKRELQQKHDQMQKMRREMVTFQKAREAWRQKQKQMVVIEERQIEQQRQAAADRSSAIIAERERKMRMKEELNQKIAAKILADEAARQDRENIIKMLQEQEFLEKNVQDDIAARAKQERVRTDTKSALTAQMDTRKRLAQEQREREAEFRKESEAKMAAENEKERDKERKKREKNRAYSTELLKQIQSNAARREKDRVLEENRAKQVWDHDKNWRSEVAQEREKIVEEHVPYLLGYLQAGVVKPEDLPAVQRGAAQHDELKTLDVASLVSARKAKTHPKCNKQCRIIREY
ncbi:meiosis-specific nuclear structural protein 1-like [Ostrinia furnacalis]|uniref:meiosis-specific nuclear structural protein 1-like n=1 Tax=Ostrinia furnacalis TaxID=93504 RepID=UPI00103BC5A5|nr:meiosis-specific nuclear structural protein 1-like [Ostrinia furnacalis]